MGDLEKDGHLKHWIKYKVDHVMLHLTLTDSACKATLLVDGERFYFQLIEFLNHALNSAETGRPF